MYFWKRFQSVNLNDIYMQDLADQVLSFDLNEDQKMIRDSVKEFVERVVAPTVFAKRSNQRISL